MKIYLESYGCTLNHGEARNMLRVLLKTGHTRTDTPEHADVIVIFTCTVIRTTELKMLRRLRSFKELEKPVVVSGCMAVIQQKEVLDIKPDTYFLLPSEINSIHLLIERMKDELNIDFEPEEEVLLEAKEFENTLQGDTIDSIVPIATGCLGNCTYCITNRARGRLKSYPEQKILEDIQYALNSGRREIRLTAQDTGCYGYDNNTNLPELINQINSYDFGSGFRVRVGMMNPDSVKSILDELVTAYSSPRLFKFLHIPVQSGDNGILKEMGRRYTVDDFLNIIEKFKAAYPGLTISTDIIIGYPTETEAKFQKSAELLEKIKPNIVNITRYSARPGTLSAKIKNKIPGRVIKDRSRRMTKLRFEISRQINMKELGNEYQVLITERIKKGSVLARNDNYTPIVVKHQLQLGRWQKVKIIDSTDAYLLGELL